MKNSTDFREDIQGLRGLSILLVLLFHIDESFLLGGYVGVDIFFVISGYLISRNLLYKNKINFIKFYLARIRRIFPAYFFMLIVITVLSSIIFIPSDFSRSYKIAFFSNLFLANSELAKGFDYFSSQSYEQPFLHLWSLSVEIQFYLLFPIIIKIIPQKKFFLFFFLY